MFALSSRQSLFDVHAVFVVDDLHFSVTDVYIVAVVMFGVNVVVIFVPITMRADCGWRKLLQQIRQVCTEPIFRKRRIQSQKRPKG